MQPHGACASGGIDAPYASQIYHVDAPAAMMRGIRSVKRVGCPSGDDDTADPLFVSIEMLLPVAKSLRVDLTKLEELGEMESRQAPSVS